MMPDLLDATGRPAWIARFAPIVPPHPFRLDQLGEDGGAYHAGPRGDGLAVIVSGAVQSDGKRWIHLSCSRRQRLPSWQDLRQAKDAFIGAEAYAVQVLPPADRYVNIHPFCLHLFHCVDGHPLPEFSALVGGVRAL